MRGKKLVGALGLLLALTLLTACTNITPPETEVAQVAFHESASVIGSGPCFLFPPGTNWHPGSNGYHNGCEKGKCSVAWKITGYDYHGPKGTPILAPFDGRITQACSLDGVGNPKLFLVSTSGEWEFGSLHQTCNVSLNQQVKVGDTIGFVDSIGFMKPKGTNHSHIWFRHIPSDTNTPDHDRFWNCIGNEPQPPGPPEPPEPPEEKKWWDQLFGSFETFLELIKSWFSSIFQPEEEPPSDWEQPEPRKHTFPVKAQKPGNSKYQYNILVFFAWLTSGKDLEKLSQIDLTDFEGKLTIAPREQTSVNEKFASEDYEKGQGMVIPPGYKIGDGSCHSASMVAFVLADAGLKVRCGDPTHKIPIPGVPTEWNCTVCVGTDAYPCSRNKDISVENTNDYPVELHWKISGDNISLWVEEEVVRPEPPDGGEGPVLPNINWVNVVIIIGGLILLGRFFSRHQKGKEVTYWVTEHKPIIAIIISEVFRLALQMSLFLIFLLAVIWEELRNMATAGFHNWVQEATTIPNWKIVVMFVAFLANLVLRNYFYAKRVKEQGGYYLLKERSKGFKYYISLGVTLATIAGVFLYMGTVIGAWSPSIPTPPPSQPSPEPPVPGQCSLNTWVPQSIRQWCNLIDEFAANEGLDPHFVAAVIRKESVGDPLARSYCDAVGLMQVMPSDLTPKTRACGAMSCGGHCFFDRPTIQELENPRINIDWGTRILGGHYRRQGNYQGALRKYNPSGGEAYVQDVMGFYWTYRGGPYTP